jgi:hypothetical protein
MVSFTLAPSFSKQPNRGLSSPVLGNQKRREKRRERRRKKRAEKRAERTREDMGTRWSTSGINLLQPRLLFTVAIGCSVEGGSSERTNARRDYVRGRRLRAAAA